MLDLPNFMIKTFKRWLRTGFLTILLLTLSLGLSAAWWDTGTQPKRDSVLPAGNAITDPQALLRYALPIDNEAVRKFQQSLEDVSTKVRRKQWSAASSDLSAASRVLNSRATELLENIPDERQPQAQGLLAQLQDEVQLLREAVDGKDTETILDTRSKMLAQVGELEALMVQEFPFEVPAEYAHLPQLKGRATIKMKTTKGDVTLIVDGYSAPVTAGNFVDLVQRGFYDGLKFIRSEESYVLQAGDPPGPDQGFIDPKTGEYRAIPLEILVRGDTEPTYGITLEAAGRYRDQPVLPFSAFGTVAMARPEAEPDGGSSQFFFFLFEPELTPAGLNLLDGRYSVFGYVVDGEEVLEQLKQNDKIVSAEVIQGAEYLVQPTT